MQGIRDSELSAVEMGIRRAERDGAATEVGVPPLKWSTNWDSMIPFQEDQIWLERETNPKRSC